MQGTLMGIDSGSCQSKYEQAMDLAEAGRHEEALTLIQEHLLDNPNDGEALNDAGALLYALGRFGEAAEHLKMARCRLPEASIQTLWNLAEVYLADGRPADAVALFDDLAEAELLSADLANRTATAFLEKDDRANAVEALLRSLRIAPDQKVLEPIVEQIRRLRPKVGFFCRPGDTRLLQSIQSFVGSRFPTSIFRGRGKEDLVKFLQGCDIAWFEHCGQEAILTSRLPKVCRTIVHVHPYEAYRPWLDQVVWPRMDVLLISGSPRVREHVARRLPDAAAGLRIEQLPYGVDAAALPFADRPGGKNLAWAANLNLRKTPQLVLQCFHALHQVDPEYRLFFAGHFEDDMLEPYVEHMLDELGLRQAVSFDGWQEDLPAWLADKHYLVAGGLVEGHGAAAMEAMAMGLKPVLHAFPGASELYRPEFLYRTPQEFCRRILDEPYEPAAYRQFVEQRYPLHRTLDKVNSILVDLEGKRLPRRPAGASGASGPNDATDAGEAGGEADRPGAALTARLSSTLSARTEGNSPKSEAAGGADGTR